MVFKILSIILSIGLSYLSYLFIDNQNLIPLYLTVFAVLATIYVWIMTLIMLNNRIKVDLDKQILSIYYVNRKEVPIKEVLDIQVTTKYSSDTRKYCYILFKLKGNQTFKILGIQNVIRTSDVQLTKALVKDLKKTIRVKT